MRHNAFERANDVAEVWLVMEVKRGGDTNDQRIDFGGPAEVGGGIQ